MGYLIVLLHVGPLSQATVLPNQGSRSLQRRTEIWLFHCGHTLEDTNLNSFRQMLEPSKLQKMAYLCRLKIKDQKLLWRAKKKLQSWSSGALFILFTVRPTSWSPLTAPLSRSSPPRM